jgi:hypothetical protein
MGFLLQGEARGGGRGEEGGDVAVVLATSQRHLLFRFGEREGVALLLMVLLASGKQKAKHVFVVPSPFF